VLHLANDKISSATQIEKVGADKGMLIPTDIGNIVTDFLVKNFETILDYNFTAKVEESFDENAEGNLDWTKMMNEFYSHFHPIVVDIENDVDRVLWEWILVTDPKTGISVFVRVVKFSPLALSGDVEDEENILGCLSPTLDKKTMTIYDA